MRKPALPGLAAFVLVSFIGLTVIQNVLVKAQAQHYIDAYKPADVAMFIPETLKDKKIITYKVAYKDTIGIIAAKYNTPWERIYNKNVSMQGPADLRTGQEIIIPAPDEILEDRPIPATDQVPVVAAATASQVTVPYGPNPAGNAYTPGNCTWYVKSKRPDLPNNLGNADTWAIRAKAQGFTTGPTPRVGAVGQRGIHVVYVERINADGTVTISEMNYRSLYAITWRTLPANYFTYIY